MSLKEYRNKRDFSRTKEPKGTKKKNAPKKKMRYVIQYHQSRTPHYDFRLEHQGVLLSWAVPKGLSTDPKDKRLAIHVEDHPLDYISFTGTIPQGNYGAGQVTIFDEGTYRPIKSIATGLKKGHIQFILDGKRLHGIWSLIHMKENQWLIVKEKEEKQEKPKRNPFQQCDVMLATLTDEIPTQDHVFEIKYDGYRILTYVEGQKVKMMTRNQKDYTRHFSSIASYFATLNRSMVVDGEIVAFDHHGRSNFSLLQESMKNKKNDLSYVLFDILALDGKDLRKEPLIKRKKILEKVMKDFPDFLLYSQHVMDHGKESFEYAMEQQMEGIMAKNIHSTYQEKRSTDWLKIKCYQRQEMIVIGFTTSLKNPDLSALLLGYYQEKQLVYAGKVGTGFRQEERKEWRKKLNRIIRKKALVSNVPEKNVYWIRPQIVIEVQFAEWTRDHLLRQASLIGIRKDKEAKDVVLETKK